MKYTRGNRRTLVKAMHLLLDLGEKDAAGELSHVIIKLDNQVLKQSRHG